jgi:hypothetical protein
MALGDLDRLVLGHEVPAYSLLLGPALLASGRDYGCRKEKCNASHVWAS